MPNRAALALSLALVLPAAPALAVEVTPTGQLFSDYTVNLGDALTGSAPLRNSFNVTRARIGINARLSNDVWGRLMTDVAANPTTGRLDAYLKYGFADVNFMGLGRIRAGAMDTLWAIPVEDDWYPFRFSGAEFTARESLFPVQDRGVMWYGGMGGVELALAAFNGEGDNPAAGAPAEGAGGSFTKAYEARLRFKPMDGAEIAVDGRVNDTPPGSPRSNTVVGGMNVKLGPAVVGAQGAYNMVTNGAGTTTSGLGGSAHVFLPKIAMDHTPVLRADYYDADPSNAASNAHMRLIAGLGMEWARGADTMISYEYTTFLKNTAVPPDQQVAVKGGLRF